MKNKIKTLLIACGLITNAALASNSVNVGYASDFFYRGSQKSQETIHSSLMLGKDFGGFLGKAHACSNQAVDTGSDSYHMGAGLSKSFSEGLISLYGGFNHFESVPGDAISEIELSISVNSLLNPKISAFRDLDETLYTFELGVSHSLDLTFANLNLEASAGNTELTSSADRSYYLIGAGLSKNISDSVDLSGSIDYVDADNIDEEFVFSTALTLRF
jgi:hypothetical protein